MAAPLILARTLLDAHTFGREELGLPKGHYRVVTSPSSISGRRGADLYLVPGHERRYDRFAMRGALRYTRLNVIDVEEWRKARQSEPDGLDGLGEQITIEDANAFLLAHGTPNEEIRDLTLDDLLEPEPDEALDALLEPEGWEPPETLTSEQVLRLAAGETGSEVAPVERKRRRRRCNECGALHFKEEPCSEDGE